MDWLFLRGKMERHKECSWNSLAECTDMWTHLFGMLVNSSDFGILLYGNGNREIRHKNNFHEYWIKSFKKSMWVKMPDIIVSRGGFKEYVPILKCFPKAKKVYYGANHGCIPNDDIKYDLILCDSEKQLRKCQKRGLNGKLFIKPAAPQFKYIECKVRKYVGFAAIHPQDSRKNVNWVYKTVPKDLKILQFGHKCNSPSNVKNIKVIHANMPAALSACKVVIAPYTGKDSCPRIIPEALACGVPVVALDSCQFWRDKYPVDVASKKYFWNVVRERMSADNSIVREIYKNELSLPVAAKYLRSLVDEICDI